MYTESRTVVCVSGNAKSTVDDEAGRQKACKRLASSDRLDLEVQRDEAEDETLSSAQPSESHHTGKECNVCVSLTLHLSIRSLVIVGCRSLP